MTVFYIVNGDGYKSIKAMAILIKHSGREIPMFPENKNVFKLREAQEVIGADIEVFPIEIDSVMIIPKDCERTRLPPNERATYIACQNDVFRCVTGDVLICASEEIEW